MLARDSNPTETGSGYKVSVLGLTQHVYVEKAGVTASSSAHPSASWQGFLRRARVVLSAHLTSRALGPTPLSETSLKEVSLLLGFLFPLSPPPPNDQVFQKKKKKTLLVYGHATMPP